MQAHASLHVLHAPLAADQLRGGTTPAPGRFKGAAGLKFAPPDLLAFVLLHRPAEAARALGVDRATVYRLRQGYWPADARALLAKWAGCKGRHAALASSWFLRRVRDAGQVRHSGMVYTGHGLAERTGQLVTVAREAGGGLLAQTLELPITRVNLVPLPAALEL